MEKRWISIKEAAKYLSLHPKTLYRQLGTEIPYAKIGGSVRVDLKRLDEILDAREREGER